MKKAWWAKGPGDNKPKGQKFSAKPVVVTRDLQMIEKATILAAAESRGIARTLPPTAKRKEEKPIRLIDLASMVGIDGEYFASKREGARYIELKLAERGGVVRELQRQPIFKLHVVNLQGLKVEITHYTADFRYWEVLAKGTAAVDLFNERPGERQIVEECKGYPTPDWELRRKWVETEYGITIRVT